MVKLVLAGAALLTILLGLSERSLGSSAIDPKGNPIPDSPTPAPAYSAPPSTVTLRSILMPSSSSVGQNDTHCDNTVNDNDNITVPIVPTLPPAPTAAPSSSAPIVSTSAPLLSSPAPSSPTPLLSSSSAPTVSSSPVPVSVGVTEATTHSNANSSPSAIPSTTTQRPREGKNIVEPTVNATTNTTVELPRGYYLPPKSA